MFQFSIEYFNFLIAIMSCGRELRVSCKVFTKNFFATKFMSHFLVQYFGKSLKLIFNLTQFVTLKLMSRQRLVIEVWTIYWEVLWVKKV